MHTDDTQAFNLWWVGNPGAMTYLLTCMIEHSSLSKFTLLGMLGAASVVFAAMDWGALRVKQMFAAEVRRLETQSDDETVQAAVSCLLTDFPEIRELWQSFSCHVPILDASWGALLKDWQHGVEKKGLLLLLLLQGWKVTDSAFWNGWCWRMLKVHMSHLNPVESISYCRSSQQFHWDGDLRLRQRDSTVLFGAVRVQPTRPLQHVWRWPVLECAGVRG